MFPILSAHRVICRNSLRFTFKHVRGTSFYVEHDCVICCMFGVACLMVGHGVVMLGLEDFKSLLNRNRKS
jgi:hypothetical protein